MQKQKTLFDIIEEESSIFRDRDVFQTNYTPETLKYRTPQLETMAFYSRKVKRGYAPNNIEIKGPNATGKTTTVTKYLQLIQEAYENVIGLIINCQIHRTEYTILTEIYKKLFNKKTQSNTLNTINIYDEIMTYITEHKKVLIVALDDYDAIKNNIELNKVLYTLLRVHETYNEAKISVITITKPQKQIILNLNINTIFLPVNIYFPTYTRSQIYDILKQRTELGFYNGVISDAYLEHLTDITYNSGNIRAGIKQLLNDGEKVEYYGKKRI